MFGVRLLELRQAKGLTQLELASRAGVSRQLVGAVENGRHLPRVDAAVALAAALETTVEELQRPTVTTADAVLGPQPVPGTLVRVGRIGGRLVCTAMGIASWDGWAGVDGVVGPQGLELFDDARPGAVVVGCDPSLGIAARLVGNRSPEAVLAVAGSTSDAVEALAAGRTHAVVVHGREGELPSPPVEVARWHLSRWQVGIAAPSDAPGNRLGDALSGRIEVIQRSPGAGSQFAFERAVESGGGDRPDGPIVNGHVEAAWLSAHRGLPAVTIEPAALAAGLDFHPLEVHVAQLWVATDWVDEPGVRRLGDATTSAGFRQRLAAVGGYDLAGNGSPVTA